MSSKRNTSNCVSWWHCISCCFLQNYIKYIYNNKIIIKHSLQPTFSEADNARTDWRMTGTNFSTSVVGGYLFQRGVCEIELLTVFIHKAQKCTIIYASKNSRIFRDSYTWYRDGWSYIQISLVILLHEKFLQFDWLRVVVFQLNLKYLHECENYKPFLGSSIKK